MNNKGFTLIELIATISLLAIIAIISFVSINEVLKQSKVRNCENLISNIKSATKEYVSDNRYSWFDSEDFSIKASLLVSEKYLSETIIDPFTDSEIDSNKITITIELKDDYTAGDITIKNGSLNVVDCNAQKW